MKKILALALAVVLCLSMCACGGSPNDQGSTEDIQTPGNTQNPEDAEKSARYASALSLLDKGLQENKNDSFQEAYKILTELGDYKDAKNYLKRLTILSDMRLYWITEHRNDFGEVIWTLQAYYRYDAAGRTIAAPNYEYYGRSDNLFEERFYYDDQGRVIQEDSDSLTIGETTTIYTYNDAGQLTETKVMSAGSTYSLAKHFYNEDGQEIRYEKAYADGRKTIVTYTYDAAGNRICMEQTGNEDGPIVTTYQYDSAGRITHSVRSTASGGKTTESYEYDSVGKLILYTYNKHKAHYTYEGDKLISVKYIKNDLEYVTNYVYGDYYAYTPAE